MKNRLGRMVLLVKDYEKSAAFYEENFDFKRTFDVTTDVGQRFLHLGSGEGEHSGIWFIEADGKEQKERVGNQTAGQPAMVIYTDDLDSLYQRLVQNKVKIKVKPVKSPEYSFLHCFDGDGNEIVVAELHS